MDNSIELSELMTTLRHELNTARALAEKDESGTKFKLNDICVELETVVSRETATGVAAKCKFWVLDAEAKANAKYLNASTQKLTFNLTPEYKGGSFEVNDEEN